MTAMTDKQTQTAQEARQLRQRRRLSDGARTLFHYVLLTTILLIVVVPLMWAVAASFTPNEQVFRYVFPFSWRALFPSDPTLDAYLNLFQLRDFGGAIANTLALSVGTVAVGLLISAMAGFAFAKFEFRAKNLLFVIVLITLMIPVEVIVIPL